VHPDIKIQLLLGGEKTVNEALRQALELQAALLTARPLKITTKIYGGTDRPPPGEETQNSQNAVAVENRATSRVTAPTEGRQNREDRSPRDKQESLRRYEWRPSNNRETNRKC
jgi:hypothetical protein